MNSPARRFNPEELKKLQEQLQAFYDQFVEKVADARHSTPEKIDALAQGRVWTGHQARRMASWTNWAASIAPWPSPSNGRRSPPTATSSWSCTRREELLRTADVAIERRERLAR